MKKLLVLLFVSLLVLGACGQKEESTKEESTKEAKKEVKKDNPKKENASKKEDKDNKSEPKTEEQSLTKEEMVQKFKNGENVDGQVDAEGNTYVQGQGGGDAMGYYKPDGSFCTVGGCVSPESQEQQDVPSDNSYIQEGQDWRNNTGTGLSSGEMQLKQQILYGTYEGQDEEEVLEAIEYYEQQYGQ